VYVRELQVRFRKRRLRIVPDDRVFTTTRDAASVLAEILGREVIEVCGLLCLSTTRELIGYHELSRGTLDSTIVHPRDVCRTALLANAASIIVGHNHPSGSLKPSADDLLITRRLVAATEVIGVELTDHVIVSASGEFFSFREASLL
jgi:DNA repair protein RadC